MSGNAPDMAAILFTRIPDTYTPLCRGGIYGQRTRDAPTGAVQKNRKKVKKGVDKPFLLWYNIIVLRKSEMVFPDGRMAE